MPGRLADKPIQSWPAQFWTILNDGQGEFFHPLWSAKSARVRFYFFLGDIKKRAEYVQSLGMGKAVTQARDYIWTVKLLPNGIAITSRLAGKGIRRYKGPKKSAQTLDELPMFDYYIDTDSQGANGKPTS